MSQMPRTLAADALREVMAPLQRANAAFAARHPGDAGGRQPVHTVYGGAQLFSADIGEQAGRAGAARRSTSTRPTRRRSPRRSACPARLADTRLRARARRSCARAGRGLPHRLRGRLRQPPGRRGGRPRRAASPPRWRAGMRDGTLPPFIGIRIKPLHRGAARAQRAHARPLPHDAASSETGGALPGNFVVTLPKVTVPEQVAALADALRARSRRSSASRAGALRLELMVETPQSILDRRRRGRAAAPARRGARAAASARTSAPTTTPRAATSPPRTSTWTTRPATSRGT